MKIERVFEHPMLAGLLAQGAVYQALDVAVMKGVICLRVDKLPTLGYVGVVVQLQGTKEAKRMLLEKAMEWRDVLGVGKLVIQCWGRDEVMQLREESGMELDPFGAMVEIRRPQPLRKNGGTNVVTLPLRVASQPTVKEAAQEDTQAGVEEQDDAGDGSGGGAVVEESGQVDNTDARPGRGARVSVQTRSVHTPVDGDVQETD